MKTKIDLARTCVTTVLVTVLLSLPVALPLMEVGVVSSQPVAESHHDPARCGHGHDHRICTQVGANFSLVAAQYTARPTHVAVRNPIPAHPRQPRLGTFLEGPPSRAPPSLA